MPEFEKRDYIRYSVNGTVNIKIEGDMPNIFKADLLDVSFLGLSVYLKERIEIGAIVQFELTTELMGRPLIGKGKIKHIKEVKRYDSSGFRTSIEFIDIDKGSIVDFLNKIQGKIAAETRRRWQTKKPDLGPL